MTTSDELPAAALAEIMEGRKIAAIKIVRKAENCSLNEANKRVEDFLALNPQIAAKFEERRVSATISVMTDIWGTDQQCEAREVAENFDQMLSNFKEFRSAKSLETLTPLNQDSRRDLAQRYGTFKDAKDAALRVIRRFEEARSEESYQWGSFNNMNR